MKNFPGKISRLKIKTNTFIRNNFPPPPKKKRLLFENVEKYFRAGKAADENTMHSHC
jgi:hypothetical protein